MGENDGPTDKNGEKDGVEVTLRRDLGLFDITMIGIGAMIGAGIFVLTGTAAGVAGPSAIIALILNGIVATITAMAYAELGSAFPEAGGGYLWAKEGLPHPSGFLSGWMSWVAHSIACALYAVAFGSYTTWLINEYHILNLGEAGISFHILVKVFAVLIIVFFVLINYMGTETTGKTEGVITLAKIVILGAFIFFGLKVLLSDPSAGTRFTTDFFGPEGPSGIIFAMGIIFIAFQGYEIIAQCGEEVKDPKKNIPKAIFISIAVVVTIYVLTMIVYIATIPEGYVGVPWQDLEGVNLETAILESARAFMPLGVIMMSIGGLLSTTSALNATVFSSSRVSFAMGRDRSMPKAFGDIHPKRNTPYKAIFISGAIIIVMAVALPIESIAASADVMFLLLFIIANMSLISLRKKRPDLERGFVVPHMAIPVLGIVFNLFLALYIWNFPGGHGKVAWWIAIAWIMAGLLIHYFTGGKEEIERVEAPTPTYSTAKKVTGKKYHVLLPIENLQDEHMVEFAAQVAKDNNGDLIILNVLEVPRTLPLHAVRRDFMRDRTKSLERLKRIAEKAGVQVRAQVNVSHNVAEAIIDVTKEEKADLLVLGWKGHPTTRARVLGTNIDYITQNAPTDVLLFKTTGWKKKVKRILVLSGPEWHVSHAMSFVTLMATKHDASITILNVIPHETDMFRTEKYTEKLKSICKDKCSRTEVRNVVDPKSIVAAVVRESKDYDLLVMGATFDWILTTYAFGPTRDRIARSVEIPVLIFRKVRPEDIHTKTDED